jgi:hypothetical protein
MIHALDVTQIRDVDVVLQTGREQIRAGCNLDFLGID